MPWYDERCGPDIRVHGKKVRSKTFGAIFVRKPDDGVGHLDKKGRVAGKVLEPDHEIIRRQGEFGGDGEIEFIQRALRQKGKCALPIFSRRNRFRTAIAYAGVSQACAAAKRDGLSLRHRDFAAPQRHQSNDQKDQGCNDPPPLCRCDIEPILADHIPKPMMNDLWAEICGMEVSPGP